MQSNWGSLYLCSLHVKWKWQHSAWKLCSFLYIKKPMCPWLCWSTVERLNAFTPPARLGCIFLWILMPKAVLSNYIFSVPLIKHNRNMIANLWLLVKCKICGKEPLYSGCIHCNLFCEKHHICHLAIVNRNQKPNWQLTRWTKNIKGYQFPKDKPRYLGIRIHILQLSFHKYWICSWIQQFHVVSSSAMQGPSSNVYQSYSTYSHILL